jgi:hypothetical protein
MDVHRARTGSHVLMWPEAAMAEDQKARDPEPTLGSYESKNKEQGNHLPCSFSSWGAKLPRLPLPLKFFDLGCEGRNDFEQVFHNAIIGFLENRCLRILVDGHNVLGCSHTGQMLNGS